METPLSDLVTPDRLSSYRYVPPMNPNPLSGPRSLSDVALLPQMTPVPSIQAVGDPSAYQAYARRLLHQSMASHATAIGTSGVASVTSPTASQPKVESSVTIKQEVNDGAPVPRAFSERELFYTALSNAKPAPLRAADQPFHVSGATFTVCCNNCSANIPDAHWHCSICQDGDFDLCHECMTKNIHCGGIGHFLIKRSIENGRVISSTTETVPKRVVKVESEKEVPGAFTSDVKEEILPEMHEMSRTCNSCVTGRCPRTAADPKSLLIDIVFEESNFVTCMVCEDYDLCIPCHVGLKHGHHPNHTFVPVSEESNLSTQATLLCAPGRHMRHFAICDGCDGVCSSSYSILSYLTVQSSSTESVTNASTVLIGITALLVSSMLATIIPVTALCHYTSLFPLAQSMLKFIMVSIVMVLFARTSSIDIGSRVIAINVPSAMTQISVLTAKHYRLIATIELIR